MTSSRDSGSPVQGLSTASYIIAIICLGLGITIGYLVRGGISHPVASAPAADEASAPKGMGANREPAC